MLTAVCLVVEEQGCISLEIGKKVEVPAAHGLDGTKNKKNHLQQSHRGRRKIEERRGAEVGSKNEMKLIKSFGKKGATEV